MAASRKSLSDFYGLSWSSWSDYTGEFTHSDGDDEDKNEKQKKSSDVMRLYSSDMQKFGLFPETDCFCTVVCSECGALVKPQGLLMHMRMRHKELLPEKSSPEKISKQAEIQSIKSSVDNKALAKLVLNEKLMSKLVLNEKHSSKTLSDKFQSSSSEKLKSNLDKTGSKYPCSDRTLLKSSDKFSGKSSNDKVSRSLSEKVKTVSEKSATGSPTPLDKNILKSETEKFLKSGSESYSKQSDELVSKIARFGEKATQKSVSYEKLGSKYAALDSNPNNDRGISVNDRHASRSGEKISVKSVLSEKLLSKAAANEKLAVNEKSKNVDFSKIELGLRRGDSLLKSDRTITRPVMKSLLKDKVLRNESTLNLVPGSSLLRPVVNHDRDSSLPVDISLGLTTLSPPILTPQNLTPESHALTTDMPILSRKRKYRERKAIPTQYDPDRHCGVWCDYFNKFCVRSLTCKVHSVALRRAVVGRSKPFDQLLMEHKRAKEGQRQSKEDLDEFSELSPLLSERLHSPSEPSNSSFVSSPCVSPIQSPFPSPSDSVFLNNASNADHAVTLCTPSASTSPPIPLPSYQYPPYPPPDSVIPTLPETAVTLSPHLSSPLLSVALPSLSPSHAPRPPDISEEDSSKLPRIAARTLNRLQLNKGKQLNVKHSAFHPKPLRTCLFQGRKNSGMFFVRRELESMRSGFRLSVIKGNKNVPLCHLTLSSQPSADSAVSLASASSHCSSDPSLQSLVMSSPSNVNSVSGFKSVLNSLSTTKGLMNRDGQQRVQRPQKSLPNGPEPTIAQGVLSESSLAAIPNEKLPQSMRISVPTNVPQQITYLTTGTHVPVTFQQVPIINPQVLSHLQLQSKGAGGTLKLLSTGGAGRTLLVHQYQDGSCADS